MLRKYIVRYNLSLLLLGILFLPGFLYLIFSIFEIELPKYLQPNFDLNGVIVNTTPEKFNLKNLASHKYQKYIETALTDKLPLRSQFIHLNNQFFYSLFKKSYSCTGELIVGKSRQLFTSNYIYNYCSPESNNFQNSQALGHWVKQLEILNNYFTKQGKVFIYFITPSKAAYMPEKIPDRFHCKVRGIPQHITEITKLLDEKHIPYINGEALMQEGKQKYQSSMFVRGGTHWNMLAASFTANALIDKINSLQPYHLPALSYDYMQAKIPFGQDRDLLDLLNLAYSKTKYPVPYVLFHPSQQPSPLSIAFICGSFGEKVMSILAQNNIFQKASYYRYFKLQKTEYEYGKPPVSGDVNLESPAGINSIYSANIIVLEENSQTTISNHGKLFFDTLQKFGV